MCAAPDGQNRAVTGKVLLALLCNGLGGNGAALLRGIKGPWVRRQRAAGP